MRLWHQITAEVIGGLAVALIVWLFSIAWQSRETYKQLQADMHEMKSNHLPHIYYVLGLICKKLGIDYEGEYKL